MGRKSVTIGRNLKKKMADHKYDIMVFDISSDMIDELPDYIRLCKGRTQLKVFSSEGDNTKLELAEIPHVRNLFRKACVEYGLLGFYFYNKELYTEQEINDECNTILKIAYGVIVNRDKNGLDYMLDTREINVVKEVSRLRYKSLYLDAC